MKINDIVLKWLGHACFLIKTSKTIYIDPYNLKDGLEKADLVLLTHSHQDHCSFEDLKKIVKVGTKILLTADSQSKITKLDIPLKIEVLEPYQELNLADMKISTFPAYNIDKTFHPKDEEWIAFIIQIGKTVIYHAGDTDLIPEMQKLTGFRGSEKDFIALLPIGGRFTMSVDEAVQAAKIIKPTLAIPMHWGSIIGSVEDAKEFVTLCKEEGINATILEKG